MTARCTCGGPFEGTDVQINVKAENGDVVLPEVPQAVCTSCGRKAYTVATLQRIEAVKRATQPGTPD